MEIKDVLRNRRIEMGFTMKELADMVKVNEGTISRWESGEIANMRRDKIKALADALRISPSVIMGWEEYSEESPEQKIAKTVSDRPDLFQLLQEAEKATPDTVYLVLEMLKRMNTKDRPD